jgi:hypothetical protein
VLSDLKYLIYIVTAWICRKGLTCDVNENHNLIYIDWLSDFLSVVIIDLCPILVVDT